MASAGAAGGEPAIFQAARQGEVTVVERLIGSLQGAELSSQLSQTGDTILHVACWEGHTRLVRMLLSRGGSLGAECIVKFAPM